MTVHDTNYEYEPWFTQNDRKEIPSFTIYLDGEPIAFTNENRPEAEQEQAARIFATAWQLLEALERCERAMEHGNAEEQDYAAKRARAAIAEARGRT